MHNRHKIFHMGNRPWEKTRQSFLAVKLSFKQGLQIINVKKFVPICKSKYQSNMVKQQVKDSQSVKILRNLTMVKWLGQTALWSSFGPMVNSWPWSKFVVKPMVCSQQFACAVKLCGQLDAVNFNQNLVKEQSSCHTCDLQDASQWSGQTLPSSSHVRLPERMIEWWRKD